MSPQKMSERKRLAALVLIMACVAVATMGISIWVLYRAAFEEERVRLIELAQSQARLIEAVARFDALYSQEDHPEGAAAATVSQVVAAYEVYQGFGRTGEFVLAKREDDIIVFLLDHREDLDDHPALHPPAPLAFNSDLAEPMRRALSGESGTVVGPDYRGVTVLAAYEPVAVLNLSIVAKIDLSEVRAPFLNAGIVSGVGAVVVILLGVPLFRRVFNPVVERLEETVANLANAQRIARLGNWDWNIVTNELRWSDEIYRVFGLEPQEFGATYEAFLNSVHPDDRAMVQEAVDKALHEGEPYSIDHRVVLPDGAERIVHEQAEITFDDAGKPLHMSGTVQDVTDRKRAEEALREQTKSVQLLQKIAVAANEAASVDEAMQACLDEVCARTKWPVGHVYMLAEDGTGELVPTGLWHLDDRKRFEVFREVTERTRFAPGVGLPGRVLSSGAPAWITDVTKDPNFPRAKLATDIGVKAGFASPVLVGKSVVAVLEFFSAEVAEPERATLEVMAHVGTQLGRVIERKRADDALRESEARFRAIYEGAGIGIIMSDINGDPMDGNAAIQRMLGYSNEEIRKMRFRDYTHSDDLAENVKLFQEMLAGKRQHYRLEKRYIRKDGRVIWGRLNVSRLATAEDKSPFAVSMVEDITERKEAEEQLRKAHDELELRVEERTTELAAANKELEAFSYSVSHDLRAPLRSMDGFSQALLEDYADKVDSEGRDHLQRVRAASQRMAQLIDDLLNLSRVGRGEFKRTKVDLSKLAEAIAANLKKAGRNRKVTFDIAPGMVAEGDVRLLRIVLENLLGNAWKFTSKHRQAKIEFGVTEHDGKRAYYVRDDGDGFDMAYADKLFQPFQRLHRADEFEGTGIGLATVARIVQRHGGRVWAESDAEQGTTMYFTL